MSKTIYFHFTNHEFEVGERIDPQEDGFTHWDESRALEAVLERYRPEGKLPRKQSVFLCKGPLSGVRDFGAAGSDYICVVSTPNDPATERSDMSWIREIDQGFDNVSILEEDYTEAELRHLAEGYWSGEQRPGYQTTFEYRTQHALVKLCLEAEYMTEKYKTRNTAERTI